MKKEQKRGIGNKMFAVGVCLVVLITAMIAFNQTGQDEALNVNLEGKYDRIPKGPVHLHPQLMIEINGEQVPIPASIGISIGRVADTQISGMRMSPIHTHDSSGTLHLEMENPSLKPEVFSLGYFFYIWEKRFDKDCLFEYCTNQGNLKMFVDGKENDEFQNYVFQGNETILINYTSTEVKT